MPNSLDKQLDQFLKTAIFAADQARIVTGKWFRSELSIDSKEDKTPVTIADQETERVIKDIITDRHPGHGFFGEESGNQLGSSEWQWIIDPIDGTKCFATGMPTFGTLISLVHEQAPVLGVIDHNILDERWIGRAGMPTLHNGKPCRSRDTDTIEKASVYTTTVDMFDEQTEAQAFKLTKSCQFRVFGGDCYGYGLIASGHNDMVCEADLKPYDFFSLIPVLQGSGAVISDWQGNTLHMESVGQVLASANPVLHRLALEKLNE